MEQDSLQGIWPEWKIVRKIGRGSYGTVYEAERTDYQMTAKAAIKVITIPQSEAEIDALRAEGATWEMTRTCLLEIVNDFVNEIKVLESLKGVQNIVGIEDYRVVEKTDTLGFDIYIRMELLTPLQVYTGSGGMTEKQIVKMGIDICTALEFCAKRQVIHRDIKPENIFVNDFGDFKLGDFGIARRLENVTGYLSRNKGTYNYMAPEVAREGEYDAAADLYSLGLVLYRFANQNRLPFLDPAKQMYSAAERKAAVRRRMNGEPLPEPCDASPELSAVIMRACAFEPKNRFVSAAAMKKALCQIAEEPGLTETLHGKGNHAYTSSFSESEEDEKTAPLREWDVSQRKNTVSYDSSAKNSVKSGKKEGGLPKWIFPAAAVLVVVFLLAVLLKNGFYRADTEKSSEVFFVPNTAAAEETDHTAEAQEISEVLETSAVSDSKETDQIQREDEELTTEPEEESADLADDVSDVAEASSDDTDTGNLLEDISLVSCSWSGDPGESYNPKTKNSRLRSWNGKSASGLIELQPNTEYIFVGPYMEAMEYQIGYILFTSEKATERVETNSSRNPGWTKAGGTEPSPVFSIRTDSEAVYLGINLANKDRDDLTEKEKEMLKEMMDYCTLSLKK